MAAAEVLAAALTAVPAAVLPPPAPSALREATDHHHMLLRDDPRRVPPHLQKPGNVLKMRNDSKHPEQMRRVQHLTGCMFSVRKPGTLPAF